MEFGKANSRIVILLVFMILLAGIVIVFGKPIMQTLTSGIISITDTLTACPKNGTYYCEYLDAYLRFTDQGTHILTCNNKDYTFVVGYDDRFHYLPSGKEDSVLFSANYFWNQGKDTLYLRMDDFPGQFQEGTSYSFVRIE